MNIKKSNKYIYLLFVCICIFYIFAWFILPDSFFLAPFRESQTAISAYYLVNNIYSIFSYQTPIMGWPWSLPFEFPFYQTILSIFSEIDINSIRNNGRFLSLCFFLLTILVWNYITIELGFREKQRLTFLIIFLISPVYFNYSFAVIIESAAIFLASVYLLFSLKFVNKNSLVFLVIALLFGLLASLTKVTTWFGFGTFLSLYIFYVYYKRELNFYKCMILISIYLLPCLSFALFWTSYTDNIKELSPISELITSQNLTEWNYGSFHQKTNILFWVYVLLKSSVMILGAVLFSAIFNIKKLFYKHINNHEKFLFFIFFVSYLAPIIVFSNLHMRHDYYAYANGLFLIGAISIVFGDNFLNRYPKNYFLLTVSMTMAMSFSYFYIKSSYINLNDKKVVAILDEIKDDGGIIILGESYSSVIPYESNRKALMIHDHLLANKIDKIIELNLNEKWSAMIITNTEYLSLGESISSGLNLDFNFEYEYSNKNFIYLNQKISDEILNNNTNSIINNFEDLKSGKLELIFNPSPGSLVAVGYCRNTTLFYLELFETNLYRFNNVCKL